MTSITGGLGQLREYDFTVSLSRLSFCVQPFVLFYQVFFSLLFFGCVLFPKTDCYDLCGYLQVYFSEKFFVRVWG